MAADLVLSLNAGSSSLKISLYQRDPTSAALPVALLLTSSITSISAPPAKFSFHLASDHHKAVDVPIDSIKDHNTAFSHFLEALRSQASINEGRIVYICHRVVHGGDYLEPVEINEESYEHIEKLSDLAPSLSVIKACISALPSAKSVAYFDTSFHRSIPSHISSYAINQEIAKKRGLKKYGFHGLSFCLNLSSSDRDTLQPPGSLNLILLHLGSGASACAVKDGKSLDTTMGLTPLNGLPGATRSGAIDPSLIFHYTNKAGRITHDPSMAAHVGVTMAEDILNRKAGWKAITGTTDFESRPGSEGPEPFRLAFDLFLDRVLHYIGAYHLKLDGEIDALVFAGGIGERGVQFRSVIGKKVECLGYPPVREDKNNTASEDHAAVVDISTVGQEIKGRTKRILVCKTDEQIEMARECVLDDRFWNAT
ncbi:Acetokinase family-domain-containing protein [Gymnopilus junonius]|uniref:Probable acetate kinase n=1 Tax=Gymnopilus junonius TaxID=109634 RepID=A0A9P5NN62_GYMJU|nr:Acetokinase family-domain-containing protein [Gymnopilus junonius]